MALSIGVNVGSKITVGTHDVVVRAVVTPTLLILQVDGGPDIMVTDKENTEILPNVKVFAGQGRRSAGNRLAFIAPKDVSIFRQEEAAVA